MAISKLDVTFHASTTDYGSKKESTQDVVEGGSETDASEEKPVFERYINLAAFVNFEINMLASWECVGLTLQYAFVNGGPASLVYGAIFAGVFTTAVALSLGEMASIDPTVGAQYRWSARFAQKWPEFWGFMQGWITVFSWIVSAGGCLSILSNMVSGLITFNNESYKAPGWHVTLYMLAFLAGAATFNFFLRRTLNTLEIVSGVFHIVFFIVAIVALPVLSDRSSVDFVFGTLTRDVSGWSNPGIAWSLGLLTVVYSITGPDGILHMIGEAKRPRERAPWAMVTAVAVSAIMQFVFVIVVLFCIGDYEKVAASGLPIVEVYYAATKSKAAATAMVVVMHGSVIVVAMINILASVSRLTWAFAKDKGLPFHSWFTWVHPTLQIPIPALMLVAGICVLLSLINIGSSIAFTALVSLPMVALSISYFIPILLLLLRKLSGKHPQYGPFKLGRWGVPINIAALCFLLFIIVWIPFPPVRPVTAENMNYAGPICIGVICLALLDWFTTGRKRFKVPVGVAVAASN